MKPRLYTTRRSVTSISVVQRLNQAETKVTAAASQKAIEPISQLIPVGPGLTRVSSAKATSDRTQGREVDDPVDRTRVEQLFARLQNSLDISHRQHPKD